MTAETYFEIGLFYLEHLQACSRGGPIGGTSIASLSFLCSRRVLLAMRCMREECRVAAPQVGGRISCVVTLAEANS